MIIYTFLVSDICHQVLDLYSQQMSADQNKRNVDSPPPPPPPPQSNTQTNNGPPKNAHHATSKRSRSVGVLSFITFT